MVQLNKDDYENPYDLLLQQKLKKEIQPKTAMMINEKFLDSPDIKPEKKMISSYLRPSVEPKYSTTEFDDVYKRKYENLNFLPKLRRLFCPFSFCYHHKWVNQQCYLFIKIN